MIARNCTVADLEMAANRVGVRLNEVREDGTKVKRVKFTIRPVKVGKETPFGRKSVEGRKINAVCFHGHLEFFRALFEIAPEATVESGMHAARLTKATLFTVAEILRHKNIGNNYRPLAYGEACNCLHHVRLEG